MSRSCQCAIVAVDAIIVEQARWRPPELRAGGCKLRYAHIERIPERDEISENPALELGDARRGNGGTARNAHRATQSCRLIRPGRPKRRSVAQRGCPLGGPPLSSGNSSRSREATHVEESPSRHLSDFQCSISNRSVKTVAPPPILALAKILGHRQAWRSKPGRLMPDTGNYTRPQSRPLIGRC